MSYGARWKPTAVEACLADAQERGRFKLKSGQKHTGTYLYRLVDDKGEYGVHPSVVAFPVLTETEAGYTIPFKNSRGWRFVGKTSYKRYAFANIDDAVDHYVRRKVSHLHILKTHIRRVSDLKAMADNKPMLVEAEYETGFEEDLDDLRLDQLKARQAKLAQERAIEFEADTSAPPPAKPSWMT